MQQVTIPQIVALNECIADYAVLPSSLTDGDSTFTMFVRYDMPQHVIVSMRQLCDLLNMHCTIQAFSNVRYTDADHNHVRITTWPK